MIIIDDDEKSLECAGHNSVAEIKELKYRVDEIQEIANENAEDIEGLNQSIVSMQETVDEKFRQTESTIVDVVETQIAELDDSYKESFSSTELSATNTTTQNIVVYDTANVENIEAVSTSSETASIDNLTVNEKAEIEEASINNLTAETAALGNITVAHANLFSTNLVNVEAQTVQSDTATSNRTYANVAKLKKIISQKYTLDDTSTWHIPDTTPDNTELLKLVVPRYSGDIVAYTADNELSFTILDNSFVSYGQNQDWLYNVTFTEEATELYFANVGEAFEFGFIYFGSDTNEAVTSSIVDRVIVERNIIEKDGVYSSNMAGGKGSGSLNIVYLTELPARGSDDTLYVVANDRTYYWSSNGYIPLSLKIDITTGHVTQGKLDENLIYPAVQYTIDGEEAFAGTFYDVSVMQSEQIPIGAKLLYVDEHNGIRFSPTYLISGTKFGKKENVDANKLIFDNIQWIKTGGKVSYNVPELNSTTWEITGDSTAFYYVNFDADPVGVEVNFTVNGEKITGIVQYDEMLGDIGFAKAIKGILEPDGTILPDENGDILHFAILYNESGKQLVAYLYSVNTIRGVGTVLSNTISGKLSTYSENAPIPLEDFIYKTDAMEVSNSSGKKFIIGSQEVQSFVDYKQNAINAILDERSAYNNLVITEVENILSENIDFSEIITLP